jgi:hypothetical protein
MSGKEGLKPTERHGANERPSSCLGFDCEHVSYKDTEGRTVLWCGKVNEKVYGIQDCPFENWFKDDKGWPIKKGSRS